MLIIFDYEIKSVKIDNLKSAINDNKHNKRNKIDDM